jgi:hypothetical protein
MAVRKEDREREREMRDCLPPPAVVLHDFHNKQNL